MKYLLILLSLLLLTGCANTVPEEQNEPSIVLIPETTEAMLPAETLPADPIRKLLDQMSLEERVGQLFLARCDRDYALEHLSSYPLGGFVLFSEDFENETPGTVSAKIAGYQNASKLPLLIAVDEEGGRVTRISQYKAFRDRKFPSLREAYSAGGMDSVLKTEAEKCALLSSLGIQVNLGPVCDITTDPNSFMYRRSLGLDPQTTADLIFDIVWTMDQCNIGSCLKHFPGYGNNTDTHTGIAIDSRTLEELEQSDLLPFDAGIRAGCGSIMVSHTIVECLDPELPASLSPAVHRYLRETMGFTGVILTDDLVMQAITDLYGAGEAAVMAVQAGNDLLCSTDYITQYNAVLAAVLDGRIDIDTLNRAAGKVLQWKIDLGLI